MNNVCKTSGMESRKEARLLVGEVGGEILAINKVNKRVIHILIISHR